jgi:hypothetical protein
MKWFQEMTEEEIKLLIEHENELEATYSDYLIEKAKWQPDAEELEIEADLRKYWRP